MTGISEKQIAEGRHGRLPDHLRDLRYCVELVYDLGWEGENGGLVILNTSDVGRNPHDGRVGALGTFLTEPTIAWGEQVYGSLVERSRGESCGLIERRTRLASADLIVAGAKNSDLEPIDIGVASVLDAHLDFYPGATIVAGEHRVGDRDGHAVEFDLGAHLSLCAFGCFL